MHWQRSHLTTDGPRKVVINRHWQMFLWYDYWADVVVTVLITARNSSCGKVMFSQACVKNSVGGEGVRGMHPQARTPPSPSTPQRILRDAVNERAVRILLECILVYLYKARHAHKRLYTVLPKYSKIQVLPGITSCRLMKYNKQAIELNSLLINNMPKDGYEWS